jgi:hypothetical protein
MAKAWLGGATIGHVAVVGELNARRVYEGKIPCQEASVVYAHMPRGKCWELYYGELIVA